MSAASASLSFGQPMPTRPRGAAITIPSIGLAPAVPSHQNQHQHQQRQHRGRDAHSPVHSGAYLPPSAPAALPNHHHHRPRPSPPCIVPAEDDETARPGVPVPAPAPSLGRPRAGSKRVRSGVGEGARGDGGSVPSRESGEVRRGASHGGSGDGRYAENSDRENRRAVPPPHAGDTGLGGARSVPAESPPGPAGGSMAVTSEEVNFLVYRYLQESGFVHSAFTFAYESLITKSGISSASEVPPGALISFLQKGLQYLGIEEQLDDDGTERPVGENGVVAEGSFTLLCPLACASIARREVVPAVRTPAEDTTHGAGLRPPATAERGGHRPPTPPRDRDREREQVRREEVAAVPHPDQPVGSLDQASDVGTSTGPMDVDVPVPDASAPPSRQGRRRERMSGDRRGAEDVVADFEPPARPATSVPEATPLVPLSESVRAVPPAPRPAPVDGDDNSLLQRPPSDSGGSSPPEQPQSRPTLPDVPAPLSAADAAAPQPRPHNDDSATAAPPHGVLELRKHTSEIFMCSWNPVHTNLIATGSGDATSRIWSMAGPRASDGTDSSTLLCHGEPGEKNMDVTTLEWSTDGEWLATGSYDGVARVWDRSGRLLHTLVGHKGPIFSLKWNRRNDYLLSGSYDKTTIVWEVEKRGGGRGTIRQQFSHHGAPALDVDWRDDDTFASCSTDKAVLICRVGEDAPLRAYTGHLDEVNAVKWDPSGNLLASCSDDCTAKVWDFGSGGTEPLHDFQSHQQEIYTVKWSPTGPGSPNPHRPLLLATASFDGSVRLWSMATGSCFRSLSRHTDSVYSVSFSPSGEYLASGALAGQLYVWNVWEGRPVTSFRGEGDIFEVSWNVEETRVAACFSSSVVCVLDFDRK